MKRARAGIKPADFIVVALVIAVLLPFFLFPAVYEGCLSLNAAHGYLMSFKKFVILATFGECIGLRIRTGRYIQPGFGILPRALVWDFIGISIKMAFVIFAEGAPYMLKTMGIHFSMADPGSGCIHHHFGHYYICREFDGGKEEINSEARNTKLKRKYEV